MEDNLKKMVNIMSDKYSRSLLINSKESDFTINFEDSINLDQDLNYELGLLWFSCFNTIFNNIFYMLTKDKTPPGNSSFNDFTTITIEPGSYEITDLAKTILKETNGNVEIKVENQTSKCIVT